MEENIKGILNAFLSQSKTENLKTSHFPNSYEELKLKTSFGQGNSARIPWISFLGGNQTTSNGIYPVYLFFKEQDKLILAYGISETTVPLLKWNLNVKTIKEYFNDLGVKPDRYGDSYVYQAYDIDKIDWYDVEKDLNNIIKEYKEILKFENADEEIQNNMQSYSIVNSELKLIINDISNRSLFNYLSIKTKPFIILAGLSGTGKSRLVRALAYQFNNIDADRTNKSSPSNFKLIKVKPNWHDSTDLLGYESRISGKDKYVVTEFIRFVAESYKHPDTPFFLCLDEMNLAPVEQYFAEYLSVLETREIKEQGKIITDCLISNEIIKKYAEKEEGVANDYNLWNALNITEEGLQQQLLAKGLCLPSNLIVIGTVNMDETTHSFSRKVLDRAMTIEMNDINLSEGLTDEGNVWDYPETQLSSQFVLSEKTHGYQVFSDLGEIGQTIIAYLEELNKILEKSPFKIAYRVRDEFLLYAYNYNLISDKPATWVTEVLDNMTLMKILPRIEGDDHKTHVLDALRDIFTNRGLQASLKKADEMIEKRNAYHYTSFWS